MGNQRKEGGKRQTHHAGQKELHGRKKKQNDPLAISDYVHDEAGFFELDEGETLDSITQHDIADAVDITSAQKFFDLKLDKLGPYRCDYTRNGRFLAIVGQRCQVAAMDWQTKKLLCEINVMETIQDVKWLHQETWFAVAQRQWTYIYDNQGIELHCLKALDSVLRLEFLPYHFLLVASNARSYITFLDVSTGQKVAGFATGLGRLDVMCQNPNNAIIHLGHPGGTVTLWSPNLNKPVVKMLCHGSGTRSIAVDVSGRYMATSGLDRKLKIWDLRTYKMLHSYGLSMGASELSFSQRGLLAAGLNNIVEIYKDVTTASVTPYLCHKLKKSGIQSIKFCPYEDVLGIGHTEGFTSILVPGSGEPNFDALEVNPLQTKEQRRQAEVKMLLEKIQPDMISIDSSAVGAVNVKTLKEKLEEKMQLQFVKPKKVFFEPRNRMKGKNKAGKREQRKQGVKEERKKEMIKQIEAVKEKKSTSTANEIDPMFKLFKKKRTN